MSDVHAKTTEGSIPWLEQRVAELEQQVAAYQASEQKLVQEQLLLRAIFDQLPSSVYAKDPALRYLMVNADFCTSVGVSEQDVIGKTDADLFPAEYAPEYMALDREVLTSGRVIEREERAHDGVREHTFLSRRFVLHSRDGEYFAVCGISTNVTMLKEAERQREQLQQEVILAQQQTLRDLSTPLIPLTTNIVVMPLIGAIDVIRVDQILQRLLEGIVANNAATAIIDVTGVPVIDTLVATGLQRLAQAGTLLGARVILTGIRPEVAQALVGLGIDLNGILTYSSLQSGIAAVMRNERV